MNSVVSCLSGRAQVQQQMGADQGDEEVVTGHRRHRDRQDDQQVLVARHDTVDHDRGEQRDGQREGLEQDGKDDHAAGPGHAGGGWAAGNGMGWLARLRPGRSAASGSRMSAMPV